MQCGLLHLKAVPVPLANDFADLPHIRLLFRCQPGAELFQLQMERALLTRF
jgi:hypothetical protein